MVKKRLKLSSKIQLQKENFLVLVNITYCSTYFKHIYLVESVYKCLRKLKVSFHSLYTFSALGFKVKKSIPIFSKWLQTNPLVSSIKSELKGNQ